MSYGVVLLNDTVTINSVSMCLRQALNPPMREQSALQTGHAERVPRGDCRCRGEFSGAGLLPRGQSALLRNISTLSGRNASHEGGLPLS